MASKFLANCNPIGIVFSSLLIRYLNAGGDYLVKFGFNRYVADVVVAVIIYMAGFTRIIKDAINSIAKKKDKRMLDQRYGTEVSLDKKEGK